MLIHTVLLTGKIFSKKLNWKDDNNCERMSVRQLTTEELLNILIHGIIMIAQRKAYEDAIHEQFVFYVEL